MQWFNLFLLTSHIRGAPILHNAFLCRLVLATVECGIYHKQQSITEKCYLSEKLCFYLHLCAEMYLRTNLVLWSTQSKGIQAHFSKHIFIYFFLVSLLPEITNFRNSIIDIVISYAVLFILRISNLLKIYVQCNKFLRYIGRIIVILTELLNDFLGQVSLRIKVTQFLFRKMTVTFYIVS